MAVQKNGQKHLCVGIAAHVDAGKTTLTEAMLYTSGAITKVGRVDHGDAFLDTDSQERARGITIFSKQARLTFGDTQITIVDTPGHMDFGAETERALWVMDLCILVISGSDGVQPHTRTLWKLLDSYDIPVIVFVNKMDIPGSDKKHLLGDMAKNLDEKCVDFTGISVRDEEFVSDGGEIGAFFESAALCSDEALDSFVSEGSISVSMVRQMIFSRGMFPCFFGSALKLDGVDKLLCAVDELSPVLSYPDEFGARIYKISHDKKGERLTWLKVTGGSLDVRGIIDDSQDKVSQIRLYSGEKYSAVQSSPSGSLCAVTGLSGTRIGQGLGFEADIDDMFLVPVITYRLILPEGMDPVAFYTHIRVLGEENPDLNILWEAHTKTIQMQIMGPIQTQILTNMIEERFGVHVGFDAGDIVYRETIADRVEGVGHFEPLRHYAEVHLLLEPLPPGSGMQFDCDVSEDVLDKNWQRLILTHLSEKVHTGILTGAPLTDMRITLIGGRAHLKHTEGGDFRQATYRAVRQGLMQAKCVLLEPYYRYDLTVPEASVGRAMSDMERLHSSCRIDGTSGGFTTLCGSGPVASLNGYKTDVLSYTGGLGSFECVVSGYAPCHNADEVIAAKAYDPLADVDNPADSVFCSHGAGHNVPWDEVFEHMHIPLILGSRTEDAGAGGDTGLPAMSLKDEKWISPEEVDAILDRVYNSNRRKNALKKGKYRLKRTASYTSQAPHRPAVRQERPKGPKYLLVDGYNIIFAWQRLRELAGTNIDSARDALLDILCNYQGIIGEEIIAVFDAYRVKGHVTEFFDYHNIHVVYTAEAETADQYIERFTHEHLAHYDIRVATSDGIEQIIIRGQGCLLVSAAEFEKEVTDAENELRAEYMKNNDLQDRTFLGDYIPALKL